MISRVLVLVMVMGGASVAQAPEEEASPPSREGWEPIQIELPRPLYTGTPKPISTPNLEPPAEGKRPPFLAPPGVSNLALRAKVTGSDTRPLRGDLEQLTDGDKEAVDGSYVELSEGVQHVQLDLGAEYALYAVAVWHYHEEARVYFDVLVMAGNDPDFVMDSKVLFNNDHDNSAGLGAGHDKEYIETNEGKLVDAGGVKARYVRLYSNGNTSNNLNHYIEVEIYGKRE